MDNKENILKDKSYKFALRIVKLYKHLTEEKKSLFYRNKFCVSALRLG